MCGRKSITDGQKRAAFVRYQLQQQGLPVDDAPADDEARETYNFPPGAYGLVYRADVPDHGARDHQSDPPGQSDEQTRDPEADAEPEESAARLAADNVSSNDQSNTTSEDKPNDRYKYQIKVMKWGLIPFWTKRSPDYSSMLRTINCRDDSLVENKGMWTTMKAKKRCLVIAQGFYEWLKKGPGPRDKVPHFVKRKDGQLMCFAGLWDCVRYEGSEESEKLYSYTIITTDSNKQLRFLHDRMPVILDPGTDDIKMWLDPSCNKWSKELQAMLKPFEGELECYPVDKDVGKVGNNSPNFIVPVDSKENKKNIANFFGNAASQKQKPANSTATPPTTLVAKAENEPEEEETRTTVDHDGSEDNAPLPVPASSPSPTNPSSDPPHQTSTSQKRRAPSDLVSSPESDRKQIKLSTQGPATAAARSPPPKPAPSTVTGKKPRSATSNKDMVLKGSSPAKKKGGNLEPGTQRITSFFGK
ncbi:uncharacterized protein A1O9_09522 [Exophiala aquamarina CBS 119918]|uniref:DUF159 domain protein n=1 Tax=Exophiala aquamarina CBS 119918 TaxID=1182545 RepID=A0A072P3E9_9EURO|nr:uncharacterized protein A1O9_09522 [Exophiala aquamarina CBS 119918]KEF54356.1 hypothetical protein A1O9_09522 [Exophiala aquamarina CBS 119918]